MSDLDYHLQNRLQDIKCWLLDMDGTITLGEALLPGADRFFKSIQRQDYIFLTNNSSHSAAHYMKRMNRLGIPADRSQVLTSTDALALYLQELVPAGVKPRVFPVGTPEFEAELSASGIELIRQRERDIDYVAIGFDTTLTYEKLDIACDYIRGGRPYLAANPDFVCPMPDNKVLPDCGSIIAFMKACTDRDPQRIIGKPDTTMIDMIMSSRGYGRHQLAMVGDRIYTDLAGAEKAGILCIAVLSGEATAAEIEASAVQPDLIFPTVGELADSISQCIRP